MLIITHTDVIKMAQSPITLKLDTNKDPLEKVKHKIVVASGKGGVGKSTVAVNLATALAMQGLKVGIMDIDIHGPNVPLMLGLEGEHPMAEENKIYPVEGPLGIKVMSMAFLLKTSDTPIIWRGPLKMKAIEQFIKDVSWDELDYLIIDSPPGTGDELLSILQLIKDVDGVVIVTTPQDVSVLDSSKAVNMAKQMNKDVLGIIENMSGFICPHCGEITYIFGRGGGANAAKTLGVPFLGEVPLEVSVRELSDKGEPFIAANPDSASAKAFLEIVNKIREKVE